MAIYYYHKKSILSLLLILITSLISVGQEKKLSKATSFATITGSVIEKTMNEPMEYANIVLYNVADSSMVNGTITDKDGQFKLEKLQTGTYYLVVDFIGFKESIINNIKIKYGQQNINLGNIYLGTDWTSLEGVEIVAEQSRVVYKLDKKIINVSKDLVSSGGAAVEVLENVPSVDVDIEGNVTLRGSSNFQVLVDGCPSLLEGNDALQQIPASSIDRIEIITNPSAKYDPDGIGGIINLVLKKQQNPGLNGILNASIGTGNKYKADILLNLRTKKFNLYGGVDYNYRDFAFTSNSEDEFYTNESTIYRISKMEGNRLRNGAGIKAGTDYFLSENTTLSLSGQYNIFGSERNSPTERHEYSLPVSFDEFSKSNTLSIRNGVGYNLTFNAFHQFDDKGHQIEAMAYYSKRNSENTTEQGNYITDADWNIIDDQAEKIRTTDDNASDELRIKTDYTKPIGEEGFFEAGYQSRFYIENSTYLFQDYDYTTNDWVYNTEFSNEADFKRNIHSAYAIFSNQCKGINYQVGLRGEFTDRYIKNKLSPEADIINRFDFFPSLHISKSIGHNQELFGSYSRRVNRPQTRQLDPFPKYLDPYNIMVGNPALEPEYIDSYELGYQKRFGYSFVSIEGFYRETKNKITRIKTVQDNGSMLNTFQNLQSDYALGGEVMANLDLNNWLKLNTSFSIYDYWLEGEVNNETVLEHSINWSTKINSTFKFEHDIRAQLTLVYRGPSATAQGSREGMFMTGLALKKELFDKKLSLTLSARNLFGEAKREMTIEGSDYYSHSSFNMESPIIQLSLSYSINNYKKPRNGQDSEMNRDMEEGF